MEKLKNKKMAVRLLWATFGSLLFAAGVNIIILPLHLYNGTFLGIAQLIRTFLVDYLKIAALSGINLDGIIFWLLNVPLFFMAWKVLGRGFFWLSVYTTTIETLFMTFIPIPNTPIIEDYLTACIIGGLVAGVGTGMILRGGSSGGGQDTLGMVCAKKYPSFSVGKVSILMNIFVYGICFMIFDIEITVYSLIYATVMAMTCDRVHVQNISLSVMIFTKKDGVEQAIMNEMRRGVTEWEGKGSYTKEDSKVFVVMISKYEQNEITRIVSEIDPNTFMIFTEGVKAVGNFEKRLS